MAKKPVAVQPSKSVRTSVTLGTEDYDELQRLADKNRVSVAWLVRHAVERYLQSERPLFRRAVQ